MQIGFSKKLELDGEYECEIVEWGEIGLNLYL